MNTKTIKIIVENIGEKNISLAGDIIKRGGIVAFPTETVYGLGANGLDEDAVEKIFKAKGRPADNPLILHVYSIEQVERLVKSIPEVAKKCIEKFWPGPLTILLKRSNLVPDIVTAGLDTVAIRMPSHKIALRLIEKSGVPIAAPSANLSGRPSPTSFKHVVEDMMGKIDMIIDGGTTGIGLESTVLDLSGSEPMILRPGGVTLEALKEIIPDVTLDPSIEDMSSNIVPKSPGQKYRHYAPKSEMIIFSGEEAKIVSEINKRKIQYLEKGKKVGIMCTDETKDLYKDAEIISLGSRSEEYTIAHNLFHTLRDFDEKDVDVILAEAVGSTNLGSAIMNRMIKASSGKIVEL